LHDDVQANKMVLAASRRQVTDNKASLDEGKRRELLDKLKG
jgi:hypothetical protein